ncbi:hypothetical protein BSKO_00354 [Bryopsis sp. KO-2023]|nr:hypothetical protein BSKO_00354 [Bryopsis sp. KO-2023]
MVDGSRSAVPVFCGNFEYEASVREIERLFERYGSIDRIDMKTGFAFIYMKDKRDAEDAIYHLDGKDFGSKRRTLRVEWAKVCANGSRSNASDGRDQPFFLCPKAKEDLRRKNAKPTSTLFVVNFDARRTEEKDLEYHFEPYGRLTRVHIRRNYAFVQYDNVDEAAEAKKKTDGSELMGRTLTVEFVANEGRRRRSPGRDMSRSRSPRRYSRSPVRSGSPRRRYRSRSRSRSYSPRRSY